MSARRFYECEFVHRRLGHNAIRQPQPGARAEIQKHVSKIDDGAGADKVDALEIF